MSEEEKQDSPSEGKEDSPSESPAKGGAFSKFNLKAATNKVNAEALRQFQIDGEAERARVKAEADEAARLKAEEEAAEAARLKALQDAADAEAARLKAEQDAADAAAAAAAEEAARLKAEQDAADAAAAEAARLAAGGEARVPTPPSEEKPASRSSSRRTKTPEATDTAGAADGDADAGADGMEGADGTVDDDAVKVGEGGAGGDEVVEPELDLGEKGDPADLTEYETDPDAEGGEGEDGAEKKKVMKKKPKTKDSVDKRELVTPVEGSDFEGDAGEGIPAKKEEASEGKKSPIEEKYSEILEYNADEDTDPGPDPNFYYNLQELYKRATTSDGPNSVPPNFLTLFHSFGYECLKRANLHVLDEQNVLFAAGNYVQILNIETKKITYLPTIGGGGIGAIAVHPSRKYFAVGEKGYEPNILIFEYPSLKLYRICRLGTEAQYAYLSFSPQGDKLSSLGGNPDYMLTIWDWRREKIILRSKAHGQDVFRVTFSTENEGQLTTGGLGHVKFWKMAATFTGLKLQGELGKFGRTPISDIEGYVELPDGKVLTGSEWGNMLLWDGDLIKVELSEQEGQNCHGGMIQEIFLDEGELITAGADGRVKIWDFETIDSADVLEEDANFPMEPMSDTFVGEGVNIISMGKTVTQDNSDTNSMWLAQDASGGIWKLDISVSLTKRAPELLQNYHAGPINGLAPCPYTHMLATIGQDGTVRVFDYLQKTNMCIRKFKAGGSSILWPGRGLDNQMSTLIAGFTDGVVRVFQLEKADQESQYELKLTLQTAAKPHNGAITAICIDDDGRTLITGSKDNTIFFFDIASAYMPVGFIKLDAAVTCMAWSSSAKKVLVGLETGVVLQVECPDPGTVDSSVTYEISPAPEIKSYPFKSVKHKLAKAQHETQLMKMEDARLKQLDKIKEEQGEEAYLEEKKLYDDIKAREEDKVFEAPALASKVLKIFPVGDKFYLSMEGDDNGALYECTMNDPLVGNPPLTSIRGEWVRSLGEPLRVIDLETEENVHEISIMNDNSNVMFGMGDGTIRIHKKMEGEGLELGPPFTLPAHGSGMVKGIMSSHDTRFLISGGEDGNLFVYKVNHAGVELSLPTPAAEMLKEKKKEEPGAPADDIDDVKAYSIEEAKQKREHEKMLKTAEDKKLKVRKTVTTLRTKFKKLKTKNKDLPGHLQVSSEGFLMDPQMGTNIADEVKDKKDLLRKQLAWNSEKHRLQLAKLRKRFKDVVATDRIVLHAIESSHTVSTFRCSKPSEAMKKALDDFKQKLATEEEVMPGSGPEGQGRRVSTVVRQGFTRKMTEIDMSGAGGPPKASKKLKDAKANKSLQKAEDRKLKRLQRESKWKNLFGRKPSENYEDPTMLAAIEDAKQNMGDFNLKTSKNYKVPESQRQGATFKRTQLLELRRNTYVVKMHFNERLLELRTKKERMIEEANNWESRLNEIQAQLSPDQILKKPVVPTMLPDEVPERKMEYTADSLREFKVKYDEEQKRGGDDGGFGGFGGFDDEDEGAKEAPKPAAPSKTVAPSVASVSTTDKTVAVEGEGIEEEKDDGISQLEGQQTDFYQMLILNEQSSIIEQMKEAYNEFNEELLKLRADKIELDVQLKNGDLRVILLFEELLLLKEFEKKENSLKDCLSSKVADKDDMSEKMDELREKLESKKMYREEMEENEKLLYESFTEALGENNKFADFLTKVFKKKIKRVKKSAEVEGDSDESDSDDDYDMSSEEEDDEDDENQLDLNVCPAGCSVELYDQTIVMREKKLDLEEAIMEEKKIIDTLKKELDALVKKNKVIDHGVKAAKGDLEAFQLEKQKKMNELDMIVTLHLDQLQYMVGGALPGDLSPCLVFHSAGVSELTSRIKELQLEKGHQIRKFKELKKSHKTLIKGRKVMSEKLVALEEKCHNMMLLKFGREVNLDKLENISTNRLAEEYKETIAKKDVKYSRKLNEWELKINQYKQHLLSVTREHTGRLDTLNGLTKEKQELEAMLDGKQKNLGGEYSGQRKADLKERQRLLQLVQLQAQEVDALKDEIGILSRKDGHILPPTQTSVPPLPPIGQRV